MLKTVAVVLKTKCNVTCYTVYVSLTFDILWWTKGTTNSRGSKSGKWSTMSNDGSLDLFDRMFSGTDLFLLENFISYFVQYCIEIRVKIMKVLIQFYCKRFSNWRRQYQENWRKHEGRSEIYSDDLLHR